MRRASPFGERVLYMKKSTKFAILASVAVVVIAIGVVAGLYLNGIINDQGSAFTPSELETTLAPVQTELEFNTPAPQDSSVPEQPPATEIPTATPTIDPFITLQEQADTSMMKNIVNVLVIGVDGDEYRSSSEWKGKKEWHSDVMLVLAVNFDEMRVDMISLPRDTYAEIPGVKGIYKLNASLNCGGGYSKEDGSINHAGFEKVCEAAEWMLGGIDVDYYYAVNMDTVKALVDAVGGIDYDIEGYYDIGGRYYEPGMQHLDGQGVLDYMRVRKKGAGKITISLSDANRVNRQKSMLTALFKKMKNENLITSIPALVQSFEGRLITNCSLAQTAALATFAYQLNPDNIGMHSMGGSGATLFHWNFTFTDQSARVKLIQQVYGVKVSGRTHYTKAYATYRWCSLLEPIYSENCAPLTKHVAKLIEEDDKLPEFTPEPTLEPTNEPTKAPASDPTNEPGSQPDTPDPQAEPPAPQPSDNGTEPNPRVLPKKTEADEVEVRKYGEEERKLWADYQEALEKLEDAKKTADKEAKKANKGSSNSLSSAANNYLDALKKLQELAIQLAKTFKYDVKNFENPCYPGDTYRGNSIWGYSYWTKKSFNEVRVDFN